MRVIRYQSIAEDLRRRLSDGEFAAAGVPFFFKQWGGVHKREAGRQLRGQTYDEMPIPLERSLGLTQPSEYRLLGA